jgi:hypothetical protein
MFQNEPGYEKCFYRWNDDIGYHHFAGFHICKGDVVNVLEKLKRNYNDTNV